MATVNSTLVSNFEALPQVANNAHELGGVKRVAQGTLEVTSSADSDVIMLAPLPTNASITSLQLASDDLDSGTDLVWDIGLYDDEGTAVDADVYADGTTVFRAATAFTEFRHTTADINTTGQQLWEDGGLSSDPGGVYYVAVFVETAGASDGTLSFKIEYVIN